MPRPLFALLWPVLGLPLPGIAAGYRAVVVLCGRRGSPVVSPCAS